MHTTFISYNSSNSYNTVDFTAKETSTKLTVIKLLMNMRHVLWHNLFLTLHTPSYCLLPGELLLDFHWLIGIKLDPEAHCKRLLSCWRQERHRCESKVKDGAWEKGITRCTNCMKWCTLLISSVGMDAQLVHPQGAFLTPHIIKGTVTNLIFAVHFCHLFLCAVPADVRIVLDLFPVWCFGGEGSDMQLVKHGSDFWWWWSKRLNQYLCSHSVLQWQSTDKTMWHRCRK